MGQGPQPLLVPLDFSYQLSWEGRGFIGSTELGEVLGDLVGQQQVGGSYGSWTEKQVPFSTHVLFSAPRKWVEDSTHMLNILIKNKTVTTKNPYWFPRPCTETLTSVLHWSLLPHALKDSEETKGLPYRTFTCTHPYGAVPI